MSLFEDAQEAINTASGIEHISKNVRRVPAVHAYFRTERTDGARSILNGTIAKDQTVGRVHRSGRATVPRVSPNKVQPIMNGFRNESSTLIQMNGSGYDNPNNAMGSSSRGFLKRLFKRPSSGNLGAKSTVTNYDLL